MMKRLNLFLLLPLVALVACKEGNQVVQQVQQQGAVSVPVEDKQEIPLEAELSDADLVKRLVVSTHKQGQTYTFNWAAVTSAVKYRVRYELEGSYLEQELWLQKPSFSLAVALGETYSIEIVAATQDNKAIAKTQGFSVTNKEGLLNDLSE